MLLSIDLPRKKQFNIHILRKEREVERHCITVILHIRNLVLDEGSERRREMGWGGGVYTNKTIKGELECERIMVRQVRIEVKMMSV